MVTLHLAFKVHFFVLGKLVKERIVQDELQAVEAR